MHYGVPIVTSSTESEGNVKRGERARKYIFIAESIGILSDT
jgi:hypothetical protein